MTSSGAASFNAVDYVVFSTSLVVSLAIGLYHWWQSKGLGNDDFLIGGRKMSPFPVAISLFAGMVSAVAILGNTSEMYYHGSQLWMNVIGTIIGTLFASMLIIPILYPLKLISIYEIFELRWQSTTTRKLAMILQMINSILYLGIALYAPSLALSSVTPIPTEVSVVVMGVICTLYASLGGAKAVVYTDTVQAFIMLAGIIAIIIQGCYEVGGAAASWKVDKEFGRIEFFNLNTDPLERNTFMSTIILGINFGFASYSSGQVQYQRMASVPTIKQAYIVVIISCGTYVAIMSLINYSGLVLFSVYAHCDPLEAGLINKIDQITPYFVIDKLGYLSGIPGLFVAAIYSGVLSTVSAIINATAANIWEDLVRDSHQLLNLSAAQEKKATIGISCVIGIIVTVMGSLSGTLGGVLQISYALSGAIGGPITGLFLTAVTCPWVKNKSAISGLLVSITLTSWMIMGNFLYAPQPAMMPLYTDGCPGHNTTTLSPFTDISIVVSTTTDGGGGVGHDVFPLYLVTYCLYGIIGVSTTFVIANLATIVFGPMDISKVPKRTVHKRSLDFYQWMKTCFGKSDSLSKNTKSNSSNEINSSSINSNTKSSVEGIKRSHSTMKVDSEGITNPSYENTNL